MKDGKKWGMGKLYSAEGIVTQKGKWEKNKPLKKMQPIEKPQEDEFQDALPGEADPKYKWFLNYLDTTIPYQPVSQPQHHYTIQFHRALFTQELFDLYRKYEYQVHHRENRSQAFMTAHICQSPVYDPKSQKDKCYQESEAPTDFDLVDDKREFRDEGIYPGLGSFHCYHRIDGKLVAVGALDITNKRVYSKYFIYDPDYNFLSLGILGRIHEIEYCKMLKSRF